MARLKQDSASLTTFRVRRRRVLALLAAPVFAVSLAAAAPSIATQDLASDRAAEAPTVSTSQLNVRGTVHGTASGAGDPVQVRVYAWPPDFAQSPDGFELILLGETEARADGTFSIRPDYSRLWREIASSRSQSRGPVTEVDLEIVAESASGVASYTTTAQVTSASRSMRFSLVTAVEQNDPEVIVASEAGGALGDGNVTSAATQLDATGLDVQMQLVEVDEGGSTDAVESPDGGDGTDVIDSPDEVVDSPNAAPPMVGTCYLSRDLGSRSTAVGAFGSTTSGYSGRLRYTSGATTSVTSGVSYTSAYGGFSASGTVSRTSTAEVAFPSYTTAGYRIMRTQFNYAVYRCPYGTHTNAWRWVTRITSFDAGASVLTASTPSAPYCVRFLSGSGYTKETTSARTLNAAVNGMYSAIGMNMSAQTGYNSATKAEFKFPYSRLLCGTNGKPGESPGTMVVKP
ncbi:hypothetical protein LG314_04895 [Agrococcus terreus]|uniref:hypothetical protein n=1 Tax=Agrococcus terreus TaxID=574649 RepID=UPI00384D1056